ncbi:MAG: radical SAM protein [Pirellulales bacterium]
MLTERCNARCIHCDIWKNRGKEDSPTVEQWQNALTNFRHWLGPAHICLTGGEALLKPFTIDLVHHGRSLGLFIELLTHGYWEDQSRIEQLARANPWRITLSLDGIGDIHDQIRGRKGFFDHTRSTIETLMRLRKEKQLNYSIRLKTVIMSHNMECLTDLAEFATKDGVDILFQPIEQNYDTAEDSKWYLSSNNWPNDLERVVKEIDRLLCMKEQGFSIANSKDSLQVMQDYFRNPSALQVSVQDHTAHCFASVGH